MAYAAVVSLAQILKHLLSPDDPFPNSTVIVLQINSRPLIESLYWKLYSLQFLLEELFPVLKSSWGTIDDLETKIRDTIYKAQDAIEYLIQSHSENASKPDVSGDDWSPTSLLFLQETIADFDSITKTANDIRHSIQWEVIRRDLLLETNALPSMPDTKISDDEIIVGHDEYFDKLKGMLLRDTPSLKVVSIVGMPGIGKTTLAKRIYNDPLILEHFDACAWVTVSPEYRAVDVLLVLVGGASKIIRDEMSYEEAASLLSTHLHQRLFNKRFLVVIDNIWDIDVWDKVQRSLPDEKTGSRVILTTQNAGKFASDACRSQNILRDPFLNDDASWELLRRVVFAAADDDCPSQLERIGRKIANNCEGLPLAIIEVGKLLRGTEKTVAKWKAVEENENPLIISANDESPLSKALTPSYKSLPMHLKALFLYMGLLPRNTEIRTSKLIKLWVSEGFIEQGASKRFIQTHPIKREEYAEKNLDELVSRSLVLVRKHSPSSGRTKTCGMHFVYRGLCISEARKQDFFHIIKKLGGDGVPQGTINTQQQRICFHNNIVLGFKQVHKSLDSISSARSLFCFGPHHQYPVKVYFPFKLLRVLESIALRFYMFPNEVFELVRLRYLAITYDGELPPSISVLFNLEVLVVRRHHHIIKSLDDPVNYLPIEIWNLHKLKHLHCMGSDLLDPSRHNGIDDSISLENLLTLSGVSAHSCVQGVLSRMPMLKKLGIRVVVRSTTHIDTTFSLFGNFTKSVLGRDFESFKCVVVNPSLDVVVSPSISPSFSINITKMTLSGCGFAWEHMSVVAMLPNLRVLKLRCYAFRGPEWMVGELEFLRLEFLLLEALDVESLYGCFPVLQRLTIRHCYKLLEIDPHLIKVSWLEMMEVDDCSPATEIWARQILGEIGEDENEDRFRAHIHSSSRDAKKKILNNNSLRDPIASSAFSFSLCIPLN